MNLEEVSIGKLGIVGLLLVSAVKAIHMLWQYGEAKAAAAARERDELRNERAELRASHALEIAALRSLHDQELSRVRLEARQEVDAVRASTTSRIEELLVEVTKLTSSLEPTLAKLSERVRR